MGYRTLVAEVSDSIHLRRFCRISLTERVPDESTIRKVTRRIGPETVAEMTRAIIMQATREKRFRPRAVRIDSTVIEADIKHPTDAGLASVGVRALAREGRKLARLVGEKKARVRDRSRAMGQKMRGIARTVRRRSGEAKSEVLDLTKQSGELLERSITEARRREELTERCEKVASQIRQRIAGEKITDRIVSLTDPDARPIRKGKIGKMTEFGYVSQLAEVTEHTRRGARGLILPASHQIGNPSENTLLPATVAQLTRLAITPREIALDGAFQPTPTNAALAELRRHDSVHRWPPGTRLPTHQAPADALPNRTEGQISRLKRRYGLDRSRLKGDEGEQIWTGWAILAYNADTLAIRER